MIISALETDLWPVIFKSLCDKSISYAVTPNTYPKVKEWKEHRYHDISIMLEDPDRPHKPGGCPLFSCWISFKRYKNIMIDIDLSIYLPKAVDIQEILAILGNEYFNIHPKLTLVSDPDLGSLYGFDFDFGLGHNPYMLLSHHGPALQEKINKIDEIVQVLYAIESAPEDKENLERLTTLLLEMQLS